MEWIFLIVWACLAVNYRNKKRNRYIERHKSKLDNDKKYEDYIKWCYSVGEIPANKEVFISEVESKEKSIKNLIQ